MTAVLCDRRIGGKNVRICFQSSHDLWKRDVACEGNSRKEDGGVRNENGGVRLRPERYKTD